MGRGGHHSKGHHRKYGSEYNDTFSDARVMIRCPKCGEDNARDALFCKQCGTALGKGKCNNCKESIPVDAKFCPNCGNRTQALTDF